MVILEPRLAVPQALRALCWVPASFQQIRVGGREDQVGSLYGPGLEMA